MAFRSLVPHGHERAVRPFWGLRSGFENLFDELWGGFGDSPASRPVFAPRVDVEETEKEIRLTAELPGLEEKDFEVVLENDVLTLKGEKRAAREEKRAGYAHVERVSGSFERSFRIPWELDPDSVKAVYKNGVLEVTLPKPVEARPEPKTIPVRNS